MFLFKHTKGQRNRWKNFKMLKAHKMANMTQSHLTRFEEEKNKKVWKDVPLIAH